MIVPTVERVVLTGVRLLDRDGRRNAADRIHLRLVHALEKLPRVGRKRLHIPPLALRIDGVESERRLPAPARPGDHVQLAQRQIEIEPLQLFCRAPRMRTTSTGTVRFRLG